MAFDKNKPLKFDLPDGECNVMTVELLESLLNEFIVPITTQESAINGALVRIDNRCQYWLDKQLHPDEEEE